MVSGHSRKNVSAPSSPLAHRSAEAIDRGRHQALDILGPTHVRHHEFRDGTRNLLSEFRDRPAPALGVAAGENDADPIARELNGGGESDTGTAARDERNASRGS